MFGEGGGGCSPPTISTAIHSRHRPVREFAEHGSCIGVSHRGSRSIARRGNDMPLPLSAKSNALPKCFPVGAKYVVEGRGGEAGDLQVVSRYVVLPTGRRINVPAELSQKQPVRVTSSRRQPRGR